MVHRGEKGSISEISINTSTSRVWTPKEKIWNTLEIPGKAEVRN